MTKARAARGAALTDLAGPTRGGLIEKRAAVGTARPTALCLSGQLA